MAIRYLFIWMHSASLNISRNSCRIIQNLDELKGHYKSGGLGDVKVKKFLNNVLRQSLDQSVST